MKRKFGFYIWFALVAVMTIFAVGRVSAAGLKVSPAIKNLTLESQQTQLSFTFTVTNDTNQEVVLRISALDFGSLDESGGVAFVSKSSDGLLTKYGLSQWMTFSTDTVVLKPGEAQKVNAIIDNKDSLAPGGHYGAVVVTPSDTELEDEENMVAVNPALSLLVFLNKTGGEKYGLRLDSLQYDKGLFSLGNSVATRFQNTGNVHVIPRGYIVLKDPRGEEIARTPLNQESAIVLPETFRTLNTKLTTNSHPRVPGKYKIEVFWRYDGQEEFDKSVVEFYYLGSIYHLLIFTVCSVLICYVVIKSIKKLKVIHSRGKTKP